jgi:hypothetical protein
VFVCDICNSGENGNGFVFPSIEIRLAYRGGLAVRGLPGLGVPNDANAAAFKMLVMENTGDWELCTTCSSLVSEGIAAFRRNIREQHFAWIGQSTVWLAARAFHELELRGRGVLRISLLETETITGRTDPALEYKAIDDLGEDDEVKYEIKMCSQYDPASEFVISFRYLTQLGALAIGHTYRIRAPIPPAEAARIERDYHSRKGGNLKPVNKKTARKKARNPVQLKQRPAPNATMPKAAKPALTTAIEFDTFISYATEDTQFANELAGGLKARGVRVWYAPLNLGLGDRILAGIDDGLRRSRTGTIIVSKKFLEKKWTGYELDVLQRQAIEQKKRLLQIWHGVTKADVEAKYLGLVGLLAIDSSGGMRAIIGRIASALTEFAPLRATVPPWENIQNRFLEGKAEIHLQKLGGAPTSIYELMVNFGPEDFPLAFEGQLYTRKDLAFHVGSALNDDPDKVRRWLSSPDQLKTLWDICLEEGVNPEECF